MGARDRLGPMVPREMRQSRVQAGRPEKVSMKLADDDPKKLLRCPNGCGAADIFTNLRKCSVCSKVLCAVCVRPIKKVPYCKKCGRAELDKRSRGL